MNILHKDKAAVIYTVCVDIVTLNIYKEKRQTVTITTVCVDIVTLNIYKEKTDSNNHYSVR